MSTFSQKWQGCMRSQHLPVPTIENANEALEFVDMLHSAWENAGGEAGMTLGALIGTGALNAAGEQTLIVLAAAVDIAVVVYLSACMNCVVYSGFDDVKKLFASNQLPAYVLDELNKQGVDLTGEAIV
jgi:hypothetical protein